MVGLLLALSALVAWLVACAWIFRRATARRAPVEEALPRDDAPPSAEPLWVSERRWRPYVESGIAALSAYLRTDLPRTD
jgi:hypothetical protein